jgi:hypothetical protein
VFPWVAGTNEIRPTMLSKGRIFSVFLDCPKKLHPGQKDENLARRAGERRLVAVSLTSDHGGK